MNQPDQESIALAEKAIEERKADILNEYHFFEDLANEVLEVTPPDQNKPDLVTVVTMLVNLDISAKLGEVLRNSKSEV